MLVLTVAASAATMDTARITATPRTLATASNRITAFAQDGNRLAWDAWGVTVHDLARRHTTRISGRADRGVLALAGDRVLYMAFDHPSNCGYYVRMMTASVRDPKPRKVAKSDMSFDKCEDHTLPRILVAGDGTTLVYNYVSYYDEYWGDELRRVIGTLTSVVRNSASPTALSVANGRVAFGRISRSWDVRPGNATWSPDGASLAVPVKIYTSDQEEPVEVAVYAVPSGSTGEIAKLFDLDTEGTEASSLDVTDLDWSPDGRRFLYVLARTVGESTNEELYAVDADGSHVERLGAGAMPRWSPDGKRIAFYSFEQEGVYVRDMETHTNVRVADGYAPAWSPDGGRLAIIRDNAILIVDLSSGQERRLPGPEGQISGGLDWSPRGDAIAYVDGPPWSIRITRVDGTGTRELCRDGCVKGSNGIAEDDEPEWSPDGSSIAFSSLEDSANYVVDSSGKHRHKLADIPVPDPESLITVRPAAGGAALSAVNLTGWVRGVALSPTLLATLVRSAAGDRIELRKPTEQAVYRTVSVPASTAPDLSASRQRVVYRIGRTIRLLDAVTGRISTLATAASTPIGLSIEGRRVAWAENVKGHGRIRALQLPPALRR